MSWNYVQWDIYKRRGPKWDGFMWRGLVTVGGCFRLSSCEFCGAWESYEGERKGKWMLGQAAWMGHVNGTPIGPTSMIHKDRISLVHPPAAGSDQVPAAFVHNQWACPPAVQPPTLLPPQPQPKTPPPYPTPPHLKRTNTFFSWTISPATYFR